MKRSLVLAALLLISRGVSACGGELTVVNDAGPAELDSTTSADVYPPPVDAGREAAADVIDASPPDAPNSQCGPTQGVHTQAGSGQGTITCNAADGGVIELLHQFAWRPQQIAVDGANLFWVEADGVVKADKTGLPLSKFCTPGTVEALIEDDTTLYATVSAPPSHTLLRISTSGGDWTQVAALSGWGLRLAVDATSVYWMESDAAPSQSGGWPTAAGPRFGRVHKDGTGQHLLITDSPPFHYAMGSDGNDLFSIGDAANGGMAAFRTTLGSPPQTTQLALSQNGFVPTGFALSAGYVYWTEFGADGVLKVRTDGTGLTLLGAGNGLTSGVLVDGAIVYWGEDAEGWNGTLLIHKTDTSGAPSQVLLAKPTAYAGGTNTSGDSESVRDFATDATTLFFSTRVLGPPSDAGNLYKICK